jgi:glyoxylase I family protein
MEKVNGIGGLFFRASDTAALADWYERHLGVRRTGETYEEGSWWQQRGPTVFAPFENGTEYFGDPSNQWMVNFRVDDLDAMVAQLVEAGITVDVAPEPYPNGRFAHLEDPEGNRIELWEPAGHDLTPPPGQ